MGQHVFPAVRNNSVQHAQQLQMLVMNATKGIIQSIKDALDVQANHIVHNVRRRQMLVKFVKMDIILTELDVHYVLKSTAKHVIHHQENAQIVLVDIILREQNV